MKKVFVTFLLLGVFFCVKSANDDPQQQIPITLTVSYTDPSIGVAIDNVDFTMDSGSHVIVKNGGVINMSTGNTFYAPMGSTVNITEGMIR